MNHTFPSRGEWVAIGHYKAYDNLVWFEYHPIIGWVAEREDGIGYVSEAILPFGRQVGSFDCLGIVFEDGRVYCHGSEEVYITSGSLEEACAKSLKAERA